MTSIGTTAALILVVIGAVHFYWAAGGRAGKAAALPSRDGRPILSPTAFGTALVGFALLVGGLLVAVAAETLPIPIPLLWARAFCGLLAIVFALRAIGDFRYVGFFKRVKESRFARLDSWAYSPLCLVLAVAIGIVATVSRGP